MSEIGGRRNGEQRRSFLEKEKLFEELDNLSSFCQQKEGKHVASPGNLNQGSFDQDYLDDSPSEDKSKILLLPPINESSMIHGDKGASALENLSRLPAKV